MRRGKARRTGRIRGKALVVRAKAPRLPKAGRNKVRGASLKGFRSFTSIV
jgi:hypothetical protein